MGDIGTHDYKVVVCMQSKYNFGSWYTVKELPVL